MAETFPPKQTINIDWIPLCKNPMPEAEICGFYEKESNFQPNCKFYRQQKCWNMSALCNALSKIEVYQKTSMSCPMPATPTIPNLTATVGQTLQEITLPDGFTWQKPETILTETGSFDILADYTPTSPTFASANNILLPVTVYDTIQE